MISRLLLIAMLSLICYGGLQAQSSPNIMTITRKDHADAALVLKALSRGWDLVDESPDIDFLIFVNEDRDELSFYPKRSLIRRMEQAGLIENTNPESLIRQPSVHYESDGAGWKQITTAGALVFRYRITTKGQRFLSDAPKSTGKPVGPLRVANSPVDIPLKPIKVVKWDKGAIDKLVDDFERDARSQIVELFSGTDLNGKLYSRLVCGPILWRTIKSRAESNGLRPSGSLVSVTSDMLGNKRETKILDDVPLSSVDELTLFVKTLREVFQINGAPSIRRAESKEIPAVVNERALSSNEASPDLVGFVITFIVDVNNSKFLVMAEAIPDEKVTPWRPGLSWIELVAK